MTNNIDDLHDIYRALPKREGGADPIGKMPLELEQHLRRYRRLSAFLGLSCVFLLLLLMALLNRKTWIAPAVLPVTPAAERHYVPQYTLPSEALWVMSYQQAAGGFSLGAESGDQPVSTKWVKNVAYHVIVGQQALAVKEYEKAAIHFEKALVIFPEIHGVRGSLGTAYLKQQKYEKAIAPLKAAAQEEPSFSAISNLGIALLATKLFERAEEHLLQALALQPEHPGCHKNLALLYHATERPEKTIGHFETYVTLCREDITAVELYADYLLGLGQRDRATAFLRKVCQQECEHNLPLYLLLAKIEARATNDVQAVETLKNITRYISPNLALTKMNLEDFDTIRDTEAFQNLLHQLELAMVTL